jgi:hypothetical protein
MPHRNRVTPLGELIAEPARGLVYGNRGCLHDPEGRVRRDWSGRRWIACRLAFRDRRRELLRPGRYTELFFLDDATALAAGHRPCAECRREDYHRLRVRWRELHAGPAGADAIDRRLHEERVAGRERRLHRAALDELPDGAFVLEAGAPWLVLGAELLRWTPAGYSERRPRPRGREATLVTPPSLVELLRAGWSPVVPFFHPSADPPVTIASVATRAELT